MTSRVYFSRLPEGTVYRMDFLQAGYSGFEIPSGIGWSSLHDFCREKFSDAKGELKYAWTGQWFWFTTEEDRDLFATECRTRLLLGGDYD